MQREMEWVRRRLMEGDGVASAETDLVRGVAGVEAKQAEVEGLLRFLEAGQAQLLSTVMVCQAQLFVVRERLDALESLDEGN